MIKEVRLKRFKRFKSETFDLHRDGLIICAGPNSSGKSTLLHALAVWAFGVTVVRQFKGDDAIRSGYSGQGAGISDDDFTPINIPDLKHLWHNLKTQLPGEGYSMSISAKWDELNDSDHTVVIERELSMAFSLVQDRLYIKAEHSNLEKGSKIPSVIYVPPVAGIDAREEFATPPKRRAMLGRGLAGAVLRNFLFDLEGMSKKNRKNLEDAKGGKRLSAAELRKFRESDPWSRLNLLARETFGFELSVVPFNSEFHSVLRVLVQPKAKIGNRWQNDGVSRDLMVEGSGAQQWLTVLTFALSPETDVLLLDEPDAHLFTRLKLELVDILKDISSNSGGPQIFLATHATEILKRYPIERIISFGESHPKFLINDVQRAKLISGLGDDYAPLIEKARSSKKLLFVENDSDRRVLEGISRTCGLQWPTDIAVVANTDKHGDRLKLYRNLLEAIDGLKAISIRDRDNLNIGCIDPVDLRQKDIKTTGFPDFLPLTWRRREIENYALVAEELAKKVGYERVEIWWGQQGWAWPQDMDVETHLFDCDIKKSLSDLLAPISTEEVFRDMAQECVHNDLRTVISSICE